MRRRGLRRYVYFAANPRVFHQEAGPLREELLSAGGLKFLGALALFNGFLLFAFPGSVEDDLAASIPLFDSFRLSLVFGDAYIVAVFAILSVFVTVSLAAYYAVISRRSAFESASRHLFGFGVYVVPSVISVAQFNLLLQDFFRVIGALDRTQQTLPELLAGNIAGFLGLFLITAVVLLTTVAGLAYFYYDARYHHYLNRVEAAVAAAFAQFILWTPLLQTSQVFL